MAHTASRTSAQQPAAAARRPAAPPRRPAGRGPSGGGRSRARGHRPGRRRRGTGTLGRVLALVLLLVVGYVAATFAQVWWTARTDAAAPADAIIVLGAAQYDGRPSPVLAARLDHAAALYGQGLAPVVVVTGGSREGDVVTEARAADAYLQARGVPADALRLETTSTSSYENIAATARIMRTEGIGDTAILVSDGWHLARAAAIARDVGLEPLPSPAPGSPYSTAGALEQMVRETGGVAVGRLIGFRRLDNLATDRVAQAIERVTG